MNPVLKKILTAVLFGLLYFVIDRFDGIATSFSNLRITYSYPLLAFCSVIYGPVVGAAAGLIGELILQTGELIPDWIAVGCTPLYCALIGFFCRDLDIENGFFDRKEAVHFNYVQILVGIGVFLILYPALMILLLHTSVKHALEQGFWTSLDIIIGCMLNTTLALGLYAKTRLSAANFYRS